MKKYLFIFSLVILSFFLMGNVLAYSVLNPNYDTNVVIRDFYTANGSKMTKLKNYLDNNLPSNNKYLIVANGSDWRFPSNEGIPTQWSFNIMIFNDNISVKYAILNTTSPYILDIEDNAQTTSMKEYTVNQSTDYDNLSFLYNLGTLTSTTIQGFNARFRYGLTTTGAENYVSYWYQNGANYVSSPYIYYTSFDLTFLGGNSYLDNRYYYYDSSIGNISYSLSKNDNGTWNINVTLNGDYYFKYYDVDTNIGNKFNDIITSYTIENVFPGSTYALELYDNNNFTGEPYLQQIVYVESNLINIANPYIVIDKFNANTDIWAHFENDNNTFSCNRVSSNNGSIDINNMLCNPNISEQIVYNFENWTTNGYFFFNTEKDSISNDVKYINLSSKNTRIIKFDDYFSNSVGAEIFNISFDGLLSTDKVYIYDSNNLNISFFDNISYQDITSDITDGIISKKYYQDKFILVKITDSNDNLKAENFYYLKYNRLAREENSLNGNTIDSIFNMFDNLFLKSNEISANVTTLFNYLVNTRVGQLIMFSFFGSLIVLLVAIFRK